VALNSTYAVRLGSIVAGATWIVLLFAPGSRADTPLHDTSPPSTSSQPPITALAAVPSTTVAPTTVAPSTITAATAATTKPVVATAPAGTGAASTAPRVLSVRDIVGVTIDRDTTWIAIATVLIVDQTNTPAGGVDVQAVWNYGPTLASCHTDSGGKCSMYLSSVPNNLAAVTLTATAPLSAPKSIPRQGVN
jgi:hypothetical protein